MPAPTTSYHRRRSAPIQQLQFPARRTAVRSRRGEVDGHAAARAERQSTLTQIDFVSTPVSRHGDADSISSDDEGGEADYIEDSQQLRQQQNEELDPRPRKRRRRATTVTMATVPKLKVKVKRERDQSTLTQKWDCIPSSSGAASRARIIDDSDDEDDLRAEQRRPVEVEHFSGDEHASSTMHERSRARPRKPRRNTKHMREVPPSGQSRKSTRTQQVTATPTTPSKPTRIVPSSQTPASIKRSSSYSPELQDRFNRSPLSERQHNVMQDRMTPRTPVGRIRFKQDHSPSPRPVATSAEDVTPVARLVFNHEATVQDSQADPETLSTEAPKESSGPASSGVSARDCEQSGTHTQYPPTQFQLTYDPVTAALERDAARYQARTQATFSVPGVTQHHAATAFALQRGDDCSQLKSSQRSHEEFVEAHEYLAANNDDDEGFRTVPSSPDGAHASRTPIGQARPTLLAAAAVDTAISVKEEYTIPDSPVASASSAGGTNLTNATQPPRPSQVSTIASSPVAAPLLPPIGDAHPAEHPSPSSGRALHRRQNTPPTTASYDVGGTCSSSPFPMPPWTASQRAARAAAAAARVETQSSDLGDFSLPPPPPLWRARGMDA